MEDITIAVVERVPARLLIQVEFSAPQAVLDALQRLLALLQPATE